MRAARLMREVESLAAEAPAGVAVWPVEGRLDELEARVQGPEGSPYEGGAFRVTVRVPERYPFEPPVMRFATRVYHPNIDGQGRICLDSLKMPPKGAWQPSLNLFQVLAQLRMLLSEPNPEDPLMPEVSELLRMDREAFEAKARAFTAKYARPEVTAATPGAPVDTRGEDAPRRGEGSRTAAEAACAEAEKGDVEHKRSAPVDENDNEGGNKRVRTDPGLESALKM